MRETIELLDNRIFRLMTLSILNKYIVGKYVMHNCFAVEAKDEYVSVVFTIEVITSSQ